MAWMPGASREQTFSGNRHREPVNIIVVHTTEGGSWPGYNGGGYAPHVTIRHTGPIRQHIDTAFSAKALVNLPGGVQTNNAGALQVECIGSCDRAYARRHGLFYWPEATDDDLEPLARFMAWAHTEHGVPLTTRGLRFSGTNAYGVNASQRMSFAEWREFSGVCGHQHVPENDHWDPGTMPVARAVELARRIVNGVRIPGGGTSVPRPTVPAGLVVDGRFGRVTVRALQEWLNAEHGAGLVVDGKAGRKTWRALQTALAAPYVDGEISRQSYAAHELGNGITQGWEHTGRGSRGSQTVELLQALTGAGVDGIWFEGTSAAVQRFLNREAA